MSIPPQEEILAPKEEPRTDPKSQILLNDKRALLEDDVEKPHLEEQRRD